MARARSLDQSTMGCILLLEGPRWRHQSRLLGGSSLGGVAVDVVTWQRQEIDREPPPFHSQRRVVTTRQGLVALCAHVIA